MQSSRPARSTYQRIPVAQTTADPGCRSAGLAARLRQVSSVSRFPLRVAALRHDEHRVVNKKKVQRLWAEEGLQR